MPTQRPITLAVLARRLNVSTTTVSKALHGKPGISRKMIRRVHELAKELHYQPNFAAQMLKTNMFDTIGVMITCDIVNPWYSQLISRLEEALAVANLNMLLALGKNDSKKERKCLINFSSGRVGGIIVGPVCRNCNLEALWQALDKGIPLLAFNCIEELPISYVAIDQHAGARIAVEHLISNGHRKIVYLGCPPPPDTQDGLWTRRDGFIETMFAHNLPITRDSIINGSNTRVFGYEQMKRILERPPSEVPTAIFCHNDNTALGAVLAIQQAGLNIPEDISIVGFDNIEESAICLPQLTTIGGVMEELAAELVHTMRNLTEQKPNHPLKKMITPKLIERKSVRNIN